MWKKVLVGLLFLGLVVGWYSWQRKSDAQAVQSVKVQRGDVRSILQLTGKVINDRTVTITALLDGEIIAIRAREGDVVKSGAILAELDSRQARAIVDKADAELLIQQQVLDAATRNNARIQRLSRAGNASKQSLDDSLDAKLRAQASVKSAEATLTLNQLRLDNATVTSPFAGTVISQSAETGQWLEAGKPLFKVVATEGTVIEALVDASDWPRIALRQSAALSTDTESKQSWVGEVNWIAPTVTNDARSGNSVAIRFLLTDDAPPLLLGQEVDVDLLVESANDVLLVPLQSLTEEAPGRLVAFVHDNGIARKRDVKLGVTSLTNAQILDGLAESEEIILLTGGVLQNDQAVESLLLPQ